MFPFSHFGLKFLITLTNRTSSKFWSDHKLLQTQSLYIEGQISLVIKKNTSHMTIIL